MKRIISLIILSCMALFSLIGFFAIKQYVEAVPLQEPPKLTPVITIPKPESELIPESISEPMPEPEENVEELPTSEQEVIVEELSLSESEVIVEELVIQLPTAYGYILQYDQPYNVETDVKLNSYIGVVYFNGHKETYYSQNVLPGGGLRIPGRHVAEDGTVRDEEGYICVAADWSYLPYGATVLTSLGPARVYDTGCDYGVVDIYVNW